MTASASYAQMSYLFSHRWSRRRVIQAAGMSVAGLASAASCVRYSVPQPKRSPVAGVERLNQEREASFFTEEYEFVMVNQQGTPETFHRGKAEVFREPLGTDVGLELVKIPGGTFVMGSPESEEGRWVDEGPQREVSIQPFWLGKYTVTQAQWQVVARLPQVNRELESDPSFFKGDARPVEQVSWFAAEEFCQRLSKQSGREYRLPSEAEWEYTCRAGTETPFHFGETITTDLANYRETDYEFRGEIFKGYYGVGPRGKFRAETMEVGSFPGKGFGLYEMHGDVYEWSKMCGTTIIRAHPQGETPGMKEVTIGTECFAVARGATTRGTAARRIASGTGLTSRTSTWVFGSSVRPQGFPSILPFS